ncbi:MAG: hypothetical protein ABEN55_16615, partial [Bradymonadaceae bacterium]
KRARTLLVQAASIEQTHWFDDLMLAGDLESGNHGLIETRVPDEVVDRVFERGLDKMREAGVRPRHMTSATYMTMIAQSLGIGTFSQAQQEAVREEEIQELITDDD